MSSVKKRVFVSYAHKDNLQKEVGELVDWLNKREDEDIEAVSDYMTPPPEDWPVWMEDEIQKADVVLCICGEAYKKSFERREGGTRGVAWEGAIIRVDLYERYGWNEKYHPILAEKNAYSFIPIPLRKPYRYDTVVLTEREKILKLIRRTTTGKATATGAGCPIFRELQRETASKPARASAIRRLHFADRAIQYVPQEEVWQAFEGFYASPDAFSWWLIAGGAGSGKSRTALEFCEFLKQKNWSAGFVSFENMHPETWPTWCPKEDTLLVIDYVAKEFSGYPEDISRIVTQLTWRAEKNELGEKRIRILLLEREYKERNKAGEELEWYKWLDKTMCYQPPFDLSTVDDKGLYEIATQTAKNIWKSPNSLPAPSDFLDKLTKLDPKKRPLFAMLLAGYLAKLNPKADISPNELLDLAIDEEFEHTLKPAGVATDSALLRALLLSTCTGGKLGAFPLQPQHALLWNSGLGELREKNGEDFFLFYPMEPDLLGERFVLTRAGGGHPRRMNTKQLEELLLSCWLEAPQLTTDFFTRCGQDFASSDSDNIAELFLSAMPMLKENSLSQVSFAKAAINLTGSYCNAGKLPEAQKLFDEMAGFGDTPEIASLRAQTAFNLILGYGIARKLPEAQKLFEEMAGLGDTLEMALLRAKAAKNLIGFYSNAGNLPKAQKLFKEMAGLGNTPGIVLERAKAAFNLILGYVNAGNLPKAQKLFEDMGRLGDTPEIALERAKATVNLILGYVNAGNLPKARKLFEDMAPFGDMPEIALERAKAAFNLIFYYGKAGKLREARQLFEMMGRLGDTPEIMLLRAKAANNLMSFYGKAGNFPEIQKLLKEMAGLGEAPEIALERAKATAVLESARKQKKS